MIELMPAETLMLHYSETFTDGNNRFQGFWNYRYNIDDPQILLHDLQQKGYITVGDISYQLQRLSAAEIKKHLSNNGLKTSGKKADLITRLVGSVDTDDIYNGLPHFFTLTDKGKAITNTSEYDCILYLHRNQSLDDYGLNINSIYDLFSGQQGDDYRKSIINILLSQQNPPYYCVAGIYAEIEDNENAFDCFIADLRLFLVGQQHQFHDPMTAPVLAQNIVNFIFPYETSLLRIPSGRLQPLRDVLSVLNYDNALLYQRIKQIVDQIAASQFFFTDSDCIQIIYSELQEDVDTLTAIYNNAEQRFKAKYGL